MFVVLHAKESTNCQLCNKVEEATRSISKFYNNNSGFSVNSSANVPSCFFCIENTVCRRLQLSGLLSFRAAKKPFISQIIEKLELNLQMLIDTGLLIIEKVYCGAMNQNTI